MPRNIGQDAAGDITSGTVATARLGSGTANSTTFLRGDNTWAALSGGSIDGSGTAGRVAEWSDSDSLAASTLAKSGAGVLTLDAGGAYTLTVPATGTAALLGTANVFTALQTVQTSTGTSNQIAFGSTGVLSRFGTQGARVHQWAVNIAQDNVTRDDAARHAIAFVIDVNTLNEFAVYDWAPSESYRELFAVRPSGAVVGYTASGGWYDSADFAARLSVLEQQATGSADVANVFAMSRNRPSGTASNGYGSRHLWQLHSSTTKNRSAAANDVLWTDATDASRTAERRDYLAKSGVLTEALRVDWGNATAGNTGLMLWDVDNNTLERVTVGAADSGGAGYKVLRIPN